MKVWYFSAPWCIPCKIFLPLVKTTCEAAKIPFKLYDIGDEANLAIASHMRIASVPTLIIFDDADQETFRYSGTLDITSLRKILGVKDNG